MIRGLLDSLGDSMFNYPVIEMVNIHMENDYYPMWVSTISYKYSNSLEPVLDTALKLGYDSPTQLRPELRNATHGAEFTLMFPNYVFPLKKRDIEVRFPAATLVSANYNKSKIFRPPNNSSGF